MANDGEGPRLHHRHLPKGVHFRETGSQGDGKQIWESRPSSSRISFLTTPIYQIEITMSIAISDSQENEITANHIGYQLGLSNDPGKQHF
ncbi:hypothetical protein M413DRAFT_271645 [Hebeloma cylindrosporum]|uniref:Uncharacterized protein n=1 Tax=Hebeloma cylindrosporum TaxID=76867 RepID=A0A0C2YBM4_HEBCY|nr:hypothetical protein M413DRAFT_271645 [Hebeloma cylindrosporum h7]